MIARASRGFTLIELALVTVLLGILVAAALPSFRGAFKTLALEEAVRSVVRTMEYARERAIMEGRRFQVRFDPEQGSYWLAVEKNGAYRRAGGRLGRRRTLPRGVSIEQGPRAVTFSPNGAGTDARVRLEGGGGRRLDVVVDGLTGRVERHEVER